LTEQAQPHILVTMSQLAIQLPAELAEFVQSTVSAGDYAGPNELVTQALYAYRDRIELDRMKLQRLRRDIQVGIDQLERGEFVEDFEVEKFLAAKRKDHAKAALAA
jgi:antitoxin ParD1/3/4